MHISYGNRTFPKMCDAKNTADVLPCYLSWECPVFILAAINSPFIDGIMLSRGKRERVVGGRVHRVVASKRGGIQVSRGAWRIRIIN